ncbi:MAG TPA: DUF2279 domain-containing protein [Cyclobacteriaceae bacterium]|nr:DUF2279 domain-containing protein [Cyclobacteriaceae bacterium]
MKAIIKILFIASVLLFSTLQVCSQSVDSAQTINKKRLRTFVGVSAATYGLTLIGLNELWYSDSQKQAFHFFNDNAEWKQVDKLGHFYSAFYLSYGTSSALTWCGVKQRRADVWGSLTGFLIMLPIEIFDGYSDAYGASSGDLLANASGAGFYLGQKLLWKEIRIQPKFSYHKTDYPTFRPDDALGDTFASELLKDYNGQTYWLSFDMDKFVKFPRWLNLTIGYGADEMVYARDGSNEAAGYQAYRQYYVGLDFDLTGIKTRSKFLKTFFAVASIIKLPAPTLEFSSARTKFHAFYF